MGQSVIRCVKCSEFPGLLIPGLRYVPVLVGYEDNAFDRNNSREVYWYDPRFDFRK